MAQDASEVYGVRNGTAAGTAGVYPPAMTDRRRIYTVSRLNQAVQRHLETGFGTLWLEGELSNLSRPASGHLYFSLKDSGAQIRCAMFRARNRNVAFEPANGAAVLVRGKLGLYAVRGDFQLIVEHMEPAGAGRLQAAFEKLKAALDARGWFDQGLKQALPPSPARVGVVTSPSSAAVRDVLQVLARRAPATEVIVYPTLTQGAAAEADIAAALATAARRSEVDVLLLVRGGGSLEDLQPFNTLAVAEAIHACSLPVISGVGHEVDVTIADLVADLRAPTPSAAAELAVPDGTALAERSVRATGALAPAFALRIRRHEEILSSLLARLTARHPERRLHERMQRVDELAVRLHRAGEIDGARRRASLASLSSRLQSRHPGRDLAVRRTALQSFRLRLEAAMQARRDRPLARLDGLTRALDAVSPLAVLDRGYAVVRKGDHVVSDTATLQAGETLDIRVSKGSLTARVERIGGSRKTKATPSGPGDEGAEA